MTFDIAVPTQYDPGLAIHIYIHTYIHTHTYLHVCGYTYALKYTHTRSTALLINHTALNTLGVRGKKEQQKVQNSMVDVSIDYTRRIVVTTMKARARRLNNTERTETTIPG
mgnify:CR=1 FL=1